MGEKNGGGGGNNEKVTTRVDAFSPGASTSVSKIYLRGSHTASQHQEVLCQVGVKYIRLSRTNGVDTIQYGASWEHTNAMPVLKETTLVGKTVGDVVRAFDNTHKQWPSYEQADCQTFAQRIYDELTGAESDDDSFM
jgi:hypothetical protein